MIYKEFPIAPDLAPYIQVLWTMESEYGGDRGDKDLVMPDGILEFVTHWRDPWITSVAGETGTVQPRSFVISQMRKYIEIESRGATGFVSVRFYPWGGYHFFGTPVSSFLDSTISSRDLWPNHYETLITDVASPTTLERRAEVVQTFLRERLGEHHKDDPHLDQAVRLIRETKGALSVEEVCSRIGISRKQLERKFVPAVGTAPKVFSRTSRFLNICHHLEDFRGKSLTELSHECSYYDQAHFIREFKMFSGFTPGDFFARKNVAFADL